MRHSRRNGLIAAVVAGGGLAAAGAGGFAFADAGASGQAERSPGLLSGNLVQLPVHVPVNVCGNTVSVVGVLNPAAGNRCANDSGHPHPGPHPSQPPHTPKPGGANGGGSTAHGGGKDSPGVLSGNGVQLPVDLPVNVSGNAVSVVGVGNGASGNTSVNGPAQPAPATPIPPAATPRPVTPPAPQTPAPEGPSLAHTGADGVALLLPAGGALLLGGVLLYRRFHPTGTS
ncbi:chaplin [Streptomyces antimicrobicus]|uniref:Chaplin n=1 Tax=Streptomyces antimicrobicus TaxID=2883108 RepID=A0ABS8BEW6_9ACTN|nr:chaplin [Streptomyces antimicrobicus]MCB5183142.1 chaplin [Streptomyces antimicrobicus]